MCEDEVLGNTNEIRPLGREFFNLEIAYTVDWG